VPFLDKDFLDVVMGIDPKDKMITPERMEKYILRKAFDDPEKPYLPHKILWRQKEQFSDGVGYSWIDSLKDFAEKEVSDDQMAAAAYRFPINPPQTKEAYLYRSIFHSHFPQDR
jgi:asparagine synthase (glutamine-hydrolysing)